MIGGRISKTALRAGVYRLIFQSGRKKRQIEIDPPPRKTS